jgi:3-oxoacyl-[acyl-carrier-protein] synthase II
MRRRVVVTGLGAITPIGNNVATMWESVVNSVNGIDLITLYDVSQLKIKIAAEVKGLTTEGYIDPKEAKRMDRSMILAMLAAIEAYQDANLSEDVVDSFRFGTFVGSGIGGLDTINEESRKAHEKSPDRMSPFFIPNSIINLIGGNIAIRFQAKGPCLPIVTACSSATNSIGEAFRYIRDGYCDIAFAGGSEAPINELGVSGFTVMRALNMTNDKDNASIPFDKRRTGFVIGEGAGIMILEEYEHAKKRGARIYAEMVGYGTTCDAFHITAPDETASGISRCIELALADGNVNPNEVDYINPHGTSTPLNDKYETLGIKKVFKEYAKQINIGATKSMHGHSLGAVGGIEAIITVKAVSEDIAPPTINYKEPDPDCDLNYTPNKSVKKIIRCAVSNSVGFGGQNATIVFKKFVE